MHRFTYDSLGRLRRDEGVAGFYQTLALTETDTSGTVAVATALGRTTTYGVEGWSNGNTRRVDESRLSQRSGGLSGPEIFAAMLNNVKHTRRHFGQNLDLIATGGIDAPDKALAALDAGATAVSYFTGFITRGPILARKILDALITRAAPSK